MKKLISFLVVLLFAAYLNVSAQNIKPDLRSFSLPIIDWSLSVDLSDYTIEKNYIAPDGSNRNILVRNENLGLTVSVYIEKARTEGDHIACRKYYWGRTALMPMEKSNIQLYEKQNIAFVEFDIKEEKGKELNYHSLNAFLSKDGYWVDVHISKTSYSEDDKPLFDNVVNTIRIDEPKKQNIPDLFIFGTQAFYGKKYYDTIKNYESLLESEVESINIDMGIWYTVVDFLGISYSMVGDHKNAIRVYDYGIKLAPNFPNFYYNKGCMFAEISELDKALEQLEIAYSKKEHLINNEKLPNPINDYSFEKYKNNKKLLEFIEKHGL
jgi:tetratricopeptide (TPR) repeat protein